MWTLNVASRIVGLDMIVRQIDLDIETRRAIRALLDDLRAQLGLPPDREKLPRLFISYAHADDPAFVERLVGDLFRVGFEVWWDRTHLPSRGVALSQELRDAILTQADRLLAVVGSEWAKKARTEGTNIHLEWHTARDACKVINLLFRGGSPDMLPEDWRGPLYFDFDDDTLYDARRDELVTKLKIAENPPGRLVNLTDVVKHVARLKRDLLELDEQHQAGQLSREAYEEAVDEPEVFAPGGDEGDAHEAGAACDPTPEMGVVPPAKCDTIPADVGENCGMVGAGLFPVAPAPNIT
jgi:hypothetical protein